MKTSILSALIGSLAMTATLNAQVVPNQLSYQGHVAVNGNGFNTSGDFKFALVDSSGTTSLWSNDGTATGEPTSSVPIDVDHGFYSVLLGDTNLPNMIPIPPSVFTNPAVHLRIWFDDGQHGSQLLTPDQAISSVGYAMMAEQVPDGSITAEKFAPDSIGESAIADGSITDAHLAPNSVNSSHIIDGEVNTQDIANDAVTTAKLDDNSVTSDKLANFIDLGDAANSGSLDIWNGFTGVRSIEMDGIGYRISTYGSDGLEQTRLWGWQHGELWLHDNEDNDRTVYLTAGNDGVLVPQLELLSSTGLDRAELLAENIGGRLNLYGSRGRDSNRSAAEDSVLRAVLYGDEGSGVGALSLRNAAGSPRARVYGGPHGRMELLQDGGGTGLSLSGGTTAGSLWLYNNAGQPNVGLWSWDNEEGVVSVRNKFGDETVYLWGRDSADTDGGQIGLKEADGTETLTMWASEVAGNGAQIVLRKSDGTPTITLDADQGGDGRITTQVLQITGGSDLSEGFEINAAEEAVRAGMVVSIDPENPGKLLPSASAYDRNAAGVVSGAGGIKPGMVMGQAGSIADGKHPVALTGRVYCLVDADYGSVRPGDLITTSPTLGHGMKVSDHNRAQGAIIGKAMSSLESGKGLVFVLVSLQ
ncbi:MAG TPA: hypothetical protein VMS21_10970 [Methylomirabilota bacterium]|nr:hypothetical protein [Methylomirabilota bacterium]